MQTDSIEMIKARIRIEDVTDPITGRIYREPIIQSDGQIYEKGFLDKWEKFSNMCPKNKSVELGKNIGIPKVKYICEQMIKQNPTIKNRVYGRKKRDFKRNMKELLFMFNNGFYSALLNYVKYELSELMENGINVFEDSIDINIMIHVLRNCKDIQTYQNNYGWRAIHFIILRCEYETVIDLINELELDLNVSTESGWYPIHFVCRYWSRSEIKNFLKYYPAHGVNNKVNGEHSSIFDIVNSNENLKWNSRRKTKNLLKKKIKELV